MPDRLRMSERPLVGISQCLDDRGRWRRGRDYLYIDAAYASAVSAAGGIPLHLPVSAGVGVAGELVARIDALIVPGGDDFAPGLGYSGVEFDAAPTSQIEFDDALVAAALERDLPLLGICYGMQLLALHRGGSLHYHLPADLPEASEHRLPEPHGRHPLSVESGSLLAEALGPVERSVNSLHHQAVSEPGAGMRVGARSPDGVIEAIEAHEHHFALGVQWHPEKLEGEQRLALFRALLTAAGS